MNGKDHAMNSRRRQSDADAHAALREGNKTLATRGGEAQPAAVDVPTKVVGDGKGAASEASEGKVIAESWNTSAREVDAPAFRKACSPRATGALISVQ